MTLRKSDGRRLLQISMKPEFYEAVRRHCQSLDLPMAIWARDLINRELARAEQQG